MVNDNSNFGKIVEFKKHQQPFDPEIKNIKNFSAGYIKFKLSI